MYSTDSGSRCTVQIVAPGVQIVAVVLKMKETGIDLVQYTLVFWGPNLGLEFVAIYKRPQSEEACLKLYWTYAVHMGSCG